MKYVTDWERNRERSHLKDLQLSLEVDWWLIEYWERDVNRYLEMMGKQLVNYNLFEIPDFDFPFLVTTSLMWFYCK